MEETKIKKLYLFQDLSSITCFTLSPLSSSFSAFFRTKWHLTLSRPMSFLLQILRFNLRSWSEGHQFRSLKAISCSISHSSFLFFFFFTKIIIKLNYICNNPRRNSYLYMYIRNIFRIKYLFYIYLPTLYIL